MREGEEPAREDRVPDDGGVMEEERIGEVEGVSRGEKEVCSSS